MADNSHGSNNEIEMVQYLNHKKYRELNLTMKEFIKYICLSKKIPLCDDTEIIAEYEKSNKLKQDIYIIINNNKIGVSLKMGTGNSCHQEKIADFINFIVNECNASKEICDLWRFFIWADGTLDGSGSLEKDETGKIKCRFSLEEYKARFPKERAILQKFINENKATLINRALFVGKYNSCVDFVYHGTYKQGQWISKDDIISYHLNITSTSDRACFTCGHLTIQAWNISATGNTEHKRGEIQLKYGSMKKDFSKLMKKQDDTTVAFFGDSEEFELSHVLNKNKTSPMWKILLPGITDFSDYYLVKVSTNQFSSLSSQKVKTKSDAYVIKANLQRDFLLSKEFVLDENDIKEMSYVVQHNTGISIKMKASKNFTYQKLTKKSFEEAFSLLRDVDFWLTALLIYSAEKERYKNIKIITDLGNTPAQFLEKVESILQISTEEIDTTAFWDAIRRKAQDKIKTTILSDSKLAEAIFMGKHWFESPYHADFIYESGHLKVNTIPEFTITTGSGRSKGNYSIEIKPV